MGALSSVNMCNDVSNETGLADFLAYFASDNSNDFTCESSLHSLS